MAVCIKIHFSPKNMLLRPFLGDQIGILSKFSNSCTGPTRQTLPNRYEDDHSEQKGQKNRYTTKTGHSAIVCFTLIRNIERPLIKGPFPQERYGNQRRKERGHEDIEAI